MVSYYFMSSTLVNFVVSKCALFDLVQHLYIAGEKQQHSLCYVLQEGPGEEVVADVSCAVEQLPVRTFELGRLRGDLAVLHHLGDPSHPAHHAHRL